MQTVRTRIAPSPTGENLHIGNVYTGLLNFAFAKKHQGEFIIRIEDTDRTRYVKGSEERILTSLKTMHLDYDEGPDIGGPYGPYRQSERLEIYQKYAEELIAKGHAEYAYYPKEGSGQKKNYTTEENVKPAVLGTTEAPPKNIAEMVKRGDWVVRMKIPQNEKVIVPDVIRGDIEFESSQLSAQVLVKSDGYPTYHMGVVVDDHLMKITHIIRAEEWISSTPKHILLYRYFGWELPVFAHVPLLRNTDKSKLSKRKSPVWISWYLEQGYLPEAILNYLALLGWSHPEEKEFFTLQEFISLFDLKDIKPVAPIFDLQKLSWMNGMYIRQTQDSELKTQIYEYYPKQYPEEIIEKTIPLVKDRLKTLADYLPLSLFFFKEPTEYDLDLSAHKELITAVIEVLETVSLWNAEQIGAVLLEKAQNLGIKNSEFFMIVRVAVTGKKVSPPLNESMELLGKEKTIAYLKKSIS